MVKFLSIVSVFALVACTSPAVSYGRVPPPTRETRIHTDVRHPACQGETHVIVDIRGVPISERGAINQDITARVLRGALPRESDGIQQFGQAEARWHTECRARGS